MGLVLGLGIITLWLVSLATFLAVELHPALALPQIAWMTFLSTGLFITAHDAMHGTVWPKNRKLNNLIGTVAVRLYAMFSYAKLLEKHHEHHAHPASAGEDPDYHDGEHAGFWRWYFHFVGNYVGIWQIVGMAVIYNVLAHVVGVPEVRLIAFWVVPALLSTLQLFTFGTYLPHRGEHPDNPHNARSNDYAPWLSFLTCYHFGYHHEHHDRPDLAWWQLPKHRATQQAT